MASTRNLLRNTVLNYLPPRAAHLINMTKNVWLNALEPEMRVVPNLVTAGSVVLDVGANLGLFASIFAQKARKVVAIEPQPRLAAYLRQVLPGHVEVIETALSDHDGEAELRIPRFTEGSIGRMDALATIEKSNDFGTVNPHSVDTIKVQIRRLDDVVANEGPISFIKIDVEGHENGVVAGAMATILKHRPVMMIEIEPRHNRNCYDLFTTLAGHGYTSWCLDHGRMRPVTREDAAKLQNWDPQAQDQGAPQTVDYEVANFFFCPADDARIAEFKSRG